MGQQIFLLDNNGSKIGCNVVAKWQDNGNSYIAYTDGSRTDGNLDLLVSKYILDAEDNLRLEDIVDDNEWEIVNKYLNDNFYKVEG